MTAMFQTQVFLEKKAGHVFKSKGFGVTPGAPSKQRRSRRAPGWTRAQAAVPLKHSNEDFKFRNQSFHR